LIRAVCDTNLIVSAFLWGGLPRALLDAARAKRFQLIASEALIDELADVLSRPKFTKEFARLAVTSDELIEHGYRVLLEIVEPAVIEPVIPDDPDDDLLVACAVGGKADYIVSGDHHLLNMGAYQNIRIKTVKEFVETILE
jgi:putative PIN family toxin of toxin-antitoxin system